MYARATSRRLLICEMSVLWSTITAMMSPQMMRSNNGIVIQLLFYYIILLRPCVAALALPTLCEECRERMMRWVCYCNHIWCVTISALTVIIELKGFCWQKRVAIGFKLFGVSLVGMLINCNQPHPLLQESVIRSSYQRPKTTHYMQVATPSSRQVESWYDAKKVSDFLDCQDFHSCMCSHVCLVCHLCMCSTRHKM